MSEPIEIDVSAVFRRLRALDQALQDSKVNKHDRATMLINACINEGLISGRRITGALATLGFNRQHAGIQLEDGFRKEPEWPYWGRRDDGTYYVPERALPDL